MNFFNRGTFFFFAIASLCAVSNFANADDENADDENGDDDDGDDDNGDEETGECFDRVDTPSCQITQTFMDQGRCPDGWMKFKEKCYTLVSDSHVTYQDAKLACYLVNPKSTLPIIRSSDEHDFIFELVTKQWKVKFDSTKNNCAGYWLDGIKLGNKFTWIDGSPLTFTKFYPTEPNSVTEQNLLVVMTPGCFTPGFWGDHYYNVLNVAICQLENPKPAASYFGGVTSITTA